MCVEPSRQVVGFDEVEQLIHRDAEVREGRRNAPSAHGDLDLVIYSLRKFVRLAAQGNPTVIQVLFIPAEQCIVRTPLGAELQALYPSLSNLRKPQLCEKRHDLARFEERAASPRTMPLRRFESR